MRDLYKNQLANVKEEVKESLINCVRYTFNEVDPSHQWITKWSKVKNIFILGIDKKAYMTDIIKAYGEDTERMNKVNDFLEENKLTKMT